MDEDTLTVGYRTWRGEPRGKQDVADNGDCIDCMACVNVCPMGIDIRDGQQLACITCGLCIDACNTTMDKIGKPHGLVGYLALTDETAERAGKPPKSLWRHILRVRTVIYTLLWGGVGVGLIVALFLRSEIDLNVTPVRNPQFVTLADGAIRNAYDLRLRNKLADPHDYVISLTSDAPMVGKIDGQADLRVTVKANETKMIRLFVTAPKGSHAAEHERSSLRIWVEDMGLFGQPDAPNPTRVHHDTVFYGKDD
jgi:cytochrome c oxidase accessory protein FixG